MFRHILVPVDDRAGSENAVGYAQRLSRLLGSRLTFVHVLCGGGDDPNALSAAQGLLERVALGSRSAPALRIAQAGNRSIPECILEAARDVKADLIVIGARGSCDSARVALGSVSQTVASSAGIPVHIIPLIERHPLSFEDRWRHAMRHSPVLSE